MTSQAFWVVFGAFFVVCGVLVFALILIRDLQRRVSRLHDLVDGNCRDLTALEQAYELAADNSEQGARPQVVLVMPTNRPRS